MVYRLEIRVVEDALISRVNPVPLHDEIGRLQTDLPQILGGISLESKLLAAVVSRAGVGVSPLLLPRLEFDGLIQVEVRSGNISLVGF